MFARLICLIRGHRWNLPAGQAAEFATTRYCLRCGLEDRWSSMDWRDYAKRERSSLKFVKEDTYEKMPSCPPWRQLGYTSPDEYEQMQIFLGIKNGTKKEG